MPFGSLRLICAAVGVLGICAQFVMAEGLSRHYHRWGRFQPGAWNLVRVVAETFEETGATISITETTTSLEDVHEDGVTLLIKRAVGLKGKQFDTDPQTVRQAFHGGLASQKATVKNLGTAAVTIQGRKIICKIECQIN